METDLGEILLKLAYSTGLQHETKVYCLEKRKHYKERIIEMRELFQLLEKAFQYYCKIASQIINVSENLQGQEKNEDDFQAKLTLLRKTIRFIEFSKQNCTSNLESYNKRLGDLDYIEKLLGKTMQYYESMSAKLMIGGIGNESEIAEQGSSTLSSTLNTRSEKRERSLINKISKDESPPFFSLTRKKRKQKESTKSFKDILFGSCCIKSEEENCILIDSTDKLLCHIKQREKKKNKEQNTKRELAEVEKEGIESEAGDQSKNYKVNYHGSRSADNLNSDYPRTQYSSSLKVQTSVVDYSENAKFGNSSKITSKKNIVDSHCTRDGLLRFSSGRELIDALHHIVKEKSRATLLTESKQKKEEEKEVRDNLYDQEGGKNRSQIVILDHNNCFALCPEKQQCCVSKALQTEEQTDNSSIKNQKLNVTNKELHCLNSEDLEYSSHHPLSLKRVSARAFDENNKEEEKIPLKKPSVRDCVSLSSTTSSSTHRKPQHASRGERENSLICDHIHKEGRDTLSLLKDDEVSTTRRDEVTTAAEDHNNINEINTNTCTINREGEKTSLHKSHHNSFPTRDEKETHHIRAVINNNTCKKDNNSSEDCFDSAGNLSNFGGVNCFDHLHLKQQHLFESLQQQVQQKSMRDNTGTSSQMFSTINSKYNHLPTISEQGADPIVPGSFSCSNRDPGTGGKRQHSKQMNTPSVINVSGATANHGAWTFNTSPTQPSTNESAPMDSVPSILDCVLREEATASQSEQQRGIANVYVQQKLQTTVEHYKPKTSSQNKNVSYYEQQNRNINNNVTVCISNPLNCQGNSNTTNLLGVNSNNNNNVTMTMTNDDNKKTEQVNVNNTVNVQYRKKRWNGFSVNSS